MDQLLEILNQHFSDGGEYEVEDFIHAYGDPKQALLSFNVFWPECVEIDGYVVLKQRVATESEKARFLSQMVGDEQHQEKVLSSYCWVEVPYQFNNRELSEEGDNLLAELMAKSWRAALAYQYPEVPITVEVIPPKKSGGVVGVGFTQQLAPNK